MNNDKNIEMTAIPEELSSPEAAAKALKYRKLTAKTIEERQHKVFVAGAKGFFLGAGMVILPVIVGAFLSDKSEDEED